MRSRAELLALPLARAAGPGFARPLRVPVPGSGRRRCPAAESLREGGGGGRRRLSAPLRPAPAWRQEVGGRGAPPPPRGRASLPPLNRGDAGPRGEVRGWLPRDSGGFGTAPWPVPPAPPLPGAARRCALRCWGGRRARSGAATRSAEVSALKSAKLPVTRFSRRRAAFSGKLRKAQRKPLAPGEENFEKSERHHPRRARTFGIKGGEVPASGALQTRSGVAGFVVG